MLQALRDLYREQLPFAREQLAKQPTVREAFSAQREAKDPVGWRAKEKDVAAMGPTFEEAFKGRRATDLYSPEAILASQGLTAENMLRQAGGGKKGSEFNPEELKRMNRIYAAGRRTYM
jgi:hypothetical protein